MRKVLFPVVCLALTTIPFAQKGAQHPRLAREAGETLPESRATHFITGRILSESSNGSSATIVVDIGGEQSWDALDDTSNTVLVVPLGAGGVMTGIGWDVNLATVGGSWRSEARFYFDGSDHDFSGLFLTPGFADSSPGTSHYTSGGNIDLTDNGIPDIPAVDGNIYIQLFEGFDDVADAVDANWNVPSTLTLVVTPGSPAVPTVNEWGMIGLGAALLGGVVFMTMRMRRRGAVLAS